MEFTRYANLTKGERAEIVARFRNNRKFCPVGQAVSYTAVDAFGLTDRQWNGKIGEDAFAATLATLVMARDSNSRYRVEGRERWIAERQ